MRRLLLVSSAAAVVLAGAAMASAQDHHHPGTVTFSPEHGHMISQHATTHHHGSFHDPHFHAQAGVALPDSIQIHPLPDTLVPHVPSAHLYRYGIVNDRPVIVDHSTRRVIHAF